VSTLISYGSRNLQATGLAALVAGQLQDSVARNGRATLAVAGGTTPKLLFRALSGAAIDWQNITIVPTDERLVPAGSPRLNASLIAKHLLINQAAMATFCSLTHKNGSATVDLCRDVDAILPLDVCVLGMGLDGHIASLMPDAPDIGDALAADAPTVIGQAPASVPEPRVTLSGRVLTAARHVHLLIHGQDKRAALDFAQKPGPYSDKPVRLILGIAQVHYAR